MAHLLDNIDQIVIADTEFIANPGERPIPVCLCWWELRSNRKFRLWQDELRDSPPYPTGPRTLFVAYFASAELGFHLELGWPMPVRVLDLYVEFRCLTNGKPLLAGRSLLGAMAHYGLDGMGAAEKNEMRDLIMRGGPWNRDELEAIMAYCWEDVEATKILFTELLPQIDLPRAYHRGRYMRSVAVSQRIGTPINVPLFRRITENWENSQQNLIHSIDKAYGVYEGNTFKQDRFERYLATHNIGWPRHKSGALELSEETFRDMARVYPQLEPLRNLRHSLSDLRLNKLAVGKDGFNRCLLSPFASKTSRNQPSTSEFIFGPSAWLRFLIAPPEGYAIIYRDWEAQEFGTAGGLSLDLNMIEAYQSGCAYLGFARLDGAIPEGVKATRETHGEIRELYKVCALGAQYCMREWTLALQINQHTLRARHLLQRHHEIFSQYWKWSDNVQDYANLLMQQHTVFGWNYFPWGFHPHSTKDKYEPGTSRLEFRPRTSRNFPVQSNSAEMMRLGMIFCTEAGLQVCCPIHDALLLLCRIEDVEHCVELSGQLMAKASQIVLKDALILRSDKKVFIYPDHYHVKRGAEMWQTVLGLLPK